MIRARRRCGYPAGNTAAIHAARAGGGTASFEAVCARCPLRVQRTTAAAAARSPSVPTSKALATAHDRQADHAWIADYRSTRPKIERKLGHLTRRTHGGRRARVRGIERVDADFRLLAAAINIARLAVLGLHRTTAGWAVTA